MIKNKLSNMKATIVSGLFFLVSACFGSNVPVLIWSPTRLMFDVHQVFAGHQVSSTDFSKHYLQELTTKSLVVFIQDQLSMDDFSKYADVYNPDSDGGVFKNVKNFMDEQFSINLASVDSPVDSLKKLQNQYKEKTHVIKTMADLEGLNLENDKRYLFLVHLPDIKIGDEEGSFANNDAFIGQVINELTKRNIDHAAVYTSSGSQDEDEALFSGRHLLADSTVVNGTFVNITDCLYFFARSVILFIDMSSSPGAKDDIWPIPLENLNLAEVERKSECGNTTATLSLVYNENHPDNYTIDVFLDISFNVSRQKMWFISNTSLAYTGMVNGTNVSDTGIDVMIQDVNAPIGFSYHCSTPPNFTANMSMATISFEGFQLQPFSIKNQKFGAPWDCIGFFTAGIWMGLFSMAILLLILLYGIQMTMSMTTMDRFDDPKGKTITINVSE